MADRNVVARQKAHAQIRLDAAIKKLVELFPDIDPPAPVRKVRDTFWMEKEAVVNMAKLMDDIIVELLKERGHPSLQGGDTAKWWYPEVTVRQVIETDDGVGEYADRVIIPAQAPITWDDDRIIIHLDTDGNIVPEALDYELDDDGNIVPLTSDESSEDNDEAALDEASPSGELGLDDDPVDLSEETVETVIPEDLEALTIPVLIEFAQVLGIDVKSRWRKFELIEAIEAVRGT